MRNETYMYRVMNNERTCPELAVMQSLPVTSMMESPEELNQFLRDLQLHLMAEEFVYLIAKDAAGVKGVFEISHGSSCMADISTRGIFTRLLLLGVGDFIVAHNHPSGHIEPSSADIKCCMTLRDASKLMGFNCMDFMIVGNGTIPYYSFLEKRVGGF